MQILLCPGKGQLFPHLPEIFGIWDWAFELTRDQGFSGAIRYSFFSILVLEYRERIFLN